MIGICSYGAYIPRYRLDRKNLFQAIGWMNSSTRGLAKGEKAVANFDEDSVTMAVAAGLNALCGIGRSELDGVYFASTTMPYKERLNAGIVAGALALDGEVRTADFSGGLKAGTTAMLTALDSLEAGGMSKVMVAASDTRLGKPGSPQEMIFGDAAAAFVMGTENVIAEFKGSYSITHDFADHYRGQFSKFDRQWEDRWIRDLGFETFVPEVVNGLLDKYSLSMEQFSHVIYDCHYPAARKKLNKVLGVPEGSEQSNFQAEVGQSGAAQSLLMLADTLDRAKPGEKILVVSFGSGCDALYFEATEKIQGRPTQKGVSQGLREKILLDNYTKFLVWREIMPADAGMRSEEDLWTRWSAVWRSHKMVLSLCGSRCTECGTAQLPAQRICVNPQCGAVDKGEDYLFSDKLGSIASFTGDMLAATLNPPAISGQVEFSGGGKMMFDFTDCDLDSLKVGMHVSMSFRRKYFDQKRDISGYFWKAVPVMEDK
ncbi:MAG: OB-fold domain-containing protein [Deltaproteobacteria bacterium]|nr:OB-fold domain-containing protein [Deltaproteobacteria bacterium]